MIKHIQSLNDSEINIFANLTERELRNNFENENGVFIAESPKVIERALNSGYEPISFLMEEKHITGDAKFLIERCPNVTVYTAPRTILEKLTGYKLTRGVLCAFKRKTKSSINDKLQEILRTSKRIAVLEDIADSTNVGAIFRSAAALKIDAVLLSPQCADPLCRRCIRVSMGNVFLINWTFIETENSQWPEKGIQLLKTHGFKTLSMALRNNSIEVTNPILKKEEKLAVLLGTEGEGLRPQTISLSDYVAKIPMKEGVDSLNVAAAAAIIFWEITKN